MTSPDPFKANVNRGALVIALLSLLLTALGFLGAGVWGNVATKRAQAWPTVSGEVVRSRVGSSSSSQGDNIGSYAPDVAYRYRVTGTEYQGTQLQFSVWSVTTSDRARVAAQVGRYPVGQSVTVHYDPARPAISALEVPGAAPVWPLVLGTALLLLGLLLLWLWRRGSLKTLIETGSVGKRIEYTPQSGVQVTDTDGHPLRPRSRLTSPGHGMGAEFTFDSNAPRQKGFNPARFAPLLLALIFGGLGGLFWFMAARDDRAVQVAQRDWQSVTGRVVASEVLAPEANLYRPSVTYEYEVAGRPYRSDRFALGDDTLRTNNRAQVAEEVARYVPGAPVTVYYDPAQPSDAVLERRSRSSGFTRLMVLIFMGTAVLCLLALIVTLRR